MFKLLTVKLANTDNTIKCKTSKWSQYLQLLVLTFTFIKVSTRFKTANLTLGMSYISIIYLVIFARFTQRGGMFQEQHETDTRYEHNQGMESTRDQHANRTSPSPSPSLSPLDEPPGTRDSPPPNKKLYQRTRFDASDVESGGQGSVPGQFT